MERVGDRYGQMERYCSTGRSPQRAVAPMEEEQKKRKKRKKEKKRKGRRKEEEEEKKRKKRKKVSFVLGQNLVNVFGSFL